MTIEEAPKPDSPPALRPTALNIPERNPALTVKGQASASPRALIAILRALPAFRGDCHPVGYASRIAFRTALRARRRSRLDTTRCRDESFGDAAASAR